MKNINFISLFATDIVNFNGEFGCQKCEVNGEFDKHFHKMCFPNICAQRRTDESFRQRQQPKHHKAERSLIEELPINMITAFPTSDPLHLLELGVMRKCIYRWIFGARDYGGKWNKQLISRVSELLKSLQTYMPSDIHRSVRGLDTVRFWKGVEFRTLLLYVGIVAFKDALKENEYLHFLTLSCAATICSSKFHSKYLSVAKVMFSSYVNKYIQLYGKSEIGSNVHNLIHICEDMEQLGIENLDKISTYRYENSLRMLGLKLKSCRAPLQQVSRRIIEAINDENNTYKSLYVDCGTFETSIQYESRFEHEIVYNKINLRPNVSLSSRKEGDQYFLTKSGDIVKMKHAIRTEIGFEIVGNRLTNKSPFFEKPITSSKLHIYASEGEFENELRGYKLDNVMAKMLVMLYKDTMVCLPILHTIDELN